MRRRFLKIYLILFYFSIVTGFAQNTTIKVIENYSGKVIPLAHVCFESLDKEDISYHVLSEEGTIINCISKPAQIAISSMGFATILDTVYPGKSYVFKMKPSVYDVDEVVVTGQYAPQKADKSIYDVKVVGKNQIEGKAANNLNDLLSNELSMRTSMSGVLGSSISLQGLSGEHVKILIDGVPVVGRMKGNLDLSQLNLQNVDHVEIVEGPMSVVYGSNALAGAINIITKNDARKKLFVDMNAYYESVGIYNMDITNQFKLGKNNFQVNLGRNFFGGYSEFDNSRVKNLKPKLQYKSDLDYSIESNKLKFRYRVEYFDEELRNNGSLMIDSIRGFINAFDEYHYTNRLNNKAFLNYKFKDNIFIEGIISHSYYHKKKKTALKDLVTLEESLVPDTSRHDTTTFNVLLFRGNMSHLVSEKFEYQFGYDINLEDGTGKRLGDDKSIDDYAGFISLKYKPVDKLSVQPGLRIIHNTKYDAPLVYSFNLLYNPIENLNARFSYGKGFRSPSLKELYLNFVDASHNVHGNANLEAEYADNYNLSFAYKFDFNQKYSLKLENKYFYNIITNKIDFLYYANDPLRADMINIDECDYKTLGTQLKLSYSMHPRFTYTLGMNKTGSSTFGALDKFTYFTDYSSSFNYKNVKYQFRINVYYKYSDKIKKYFLSVDDLGNEEVFESYVSDYHMLDFTFAYPFFNGNLLLSVGLKNIFDNKSVVSGGSGSGAHSGSGGESSLVAYGRTYFFKLNYNFSKY
jgi:outer membrane receptor for ferrienterochelin and colicins